MPIVESKAFQEAVIERRKQKDAEDDVAQHDGVIEASERHDGQVVERGPEAAQRAGPQEGPADLIRDRIESVAGSREEAGGEKGHPLVDVEQKEHQQEN